MSLLTFFKKRGSKGHYFSLTSKGRNRNLRKECFQMSLKHKVIINVKDENGEKTRVVEGKRKTVRSRMLDLFFGKKVNMLVITPGDSVDTVEIKENRKGGEAIYDQKKINN